MVRYVTLDELVYINEQVLADQPIHTIVEGKRAVRDMSLLDSAAGRPQQSIFGADAFPTLPEKAAALLHAIARNHPFADGNKRTATLAALFMLHVNGAALEWDAEQALEWIVALAEGRQTVEAFAAWLPLTPAQATLVAQAEADMATIHALMTAHHRLLTELAGR
jgi:death-on-curing protein